MNVNFGLFPEPVDPGPKRAKGRDRKKLYTDRAKVDFADWAQELKKAA